MALETTGFNISGAQPDLSQGYALGALKPLSFARGGQSPMAIAPLAGWKVESAHPEQVMQGLGSGLTAIAQGISAAYISKHQEDLKKDERKQEIQLKQQEMANQRTIAGMHAASTEASQAETNRHNLAMEELKQGIEDRTPAGNKRSLAPLPLTPPDQEHSSRTEENPTFFGNEPETNYLKNQFDISNEGKPLGMKKMDDSQSNILANLGTDIFSKKGDMIAAGPYAGGGISSDTGSQTAINTPSSKAISDQDASRIFAKYNTSYGNFGIPISAPLAASQELQNDEFKKHLLAADVAEQKQFGMLPEQQNQFPENILEQDVNIDAVHSLPKAKALYNYAVLHNLPHPHLASTTRGVEVTWPSQAEAKRTSMLGDLGTERLKQREEFKNIDLFNQSVDKFNADTQVKKATEKLKPTMEKFFGDLIELTRMGEGYGRRSILDQSLIDQYIRFATGSTPSEAQYHNLTSNRALWDKLQSLYGKNTAASSSSLLNPEERKQMAESMVNVLNQEHEGLNTTIDSKKRLIDKLKNANITEDNKPHHYPILKMEADVEKDLSTAEKDMRKAWGDGKNNQPKDPDAYKEAIKRHADLVQQLEIAKTGIPANFDDLKKYGENVDGTYYPAGWKGRLIYHESPQQPIFITPDVGQQ